MIPQARPYCDQFSSSTCESPTAFHLLVFYCSLGLISVGAGGIRSSCLAFGADQVDDRNNPENPETFQSFFSWYYATVSFSALISLISIVYIQDKMGWKMGFGVPVMLMFVSALSFFLASSLYIKVQARASLFTGFAQVIMASSRNSHVENHDVCDCFHILFYSNSRIQAGTMDRHITPNFEVPAGSFGMFTLISLIVWIAFYDRIALPLASKIKGKPVRLSLKQRMGIGLLCSCASMVVLAIVEYNRRKLAIQEGFSDEPHAQVHMSALWLLPHDVLAGLAEALNGIGQIEFCYSELPKNMSTIAANIFGLGAFPSLQI
ncbi:hypothetical protein GQ457_10G017880 [Hibiscus cannabinus]